MKQHNTQKWPKNSYIFLILEPVGRFVHCKKCSPPNMANKMSLNSYLDHHLCLIFQIWLHNNASRQKGHLIVHLASGSKSSGTRWASWSAFSRKSLKKHVMKIEGQVISRRTSYFIQRSKIKVDHKSQVLPSCNLLTVSHTRNTLICQVWFKKNILLKMMLGLSRVLHTKHCQINYLTSLTSWSLFCKLWFSRALS